MSPFSVLLELRVIVVVVTTGAVNHQQINTEVFYGPDALPVAQPTVS